MDTPPVFEASNGVKLIPGGYRHEDSRDAEIESWLAARDEAREAGFDLSYQAQREFASGPAAMLADAPPKRKRPLFAFEDLGDIEDEDDAPDWIVEDYLESDTLNAIFGRPGCCKTFTASDLAAHIGAGVSWHGSQVKAGWVLYIVGEGRRGLKRRFKAWGRKHGKRWKDMRVALSTMGTALTDPLAAEELLAVISDFIDRHGEAPVLIVVDTLARNFGPGDENGQQDMGVAIGTLDRARHLTGAAVLLLHHTSKANDDAPRGSGSFLGAVESCYQVTLAADGLVTFRSDRQRDRDNEDAPTKYFRLERIDLGYQDRYGKPVRSAVLAEADTPIARAANVGSGKHQQGLLAHLDRLMALHERRLIDGGHSPGTACVTTTDLRSACIGPDMTESRYYDALNSLVDAGVLTKANGKIRRTANPE